VVGLAAAALIGPPAALAQPPVKPAPPAQADEPADIPLPGSAAQALGWATAAYERGDLDRMVDVSRLVAEGALPADDQQRTQALRLLGIGLYLSGRPDGADRAFTELLRLHPRAQLDPRVTRPEVVAFFQEVRRRNRPRKYWALSFLPPFGQFQNETPRRGWILAGVEALTLGTVITTALLRQSWLNDSDGTCQPDPSRPARCQNLKTVNLVSAGAFAATWAVGVVDALMNYQDGDDPTAEPQVSFLLLPSAAALRVRF
jgi:hypothetical protein